MIPILSRTLFGLTQRYSGAPLYQRLAELTASEFLPRQELEDMQWQRLSALLLHAYETVPFYRRVWNEHGIKLSQIQSSADLQSLPYLTKADVQQHYEDLQSSSIKGSPLHYGKTSGSSGNPMRFLRTQDSKARFWAAQYRSYGWFGIRPGDRQGRFYGMPFDQAQSKKELLKDFAMNRKRLLGVFDLADDRLAAYAQAMNDFRPIYFNGYSTWLGRFAEFISQQDKSKYNWIPLKGVVTTSEVLHDHHRKLIEETFECSVINEYGAAEIGLIASSCPSGGFHTVPENTILEQVPTDTRHSIVDAPTEYREVVVTDLHSHAMPFIRYKVGDFLERLPNEGIVCECGRTSKLVGPVQGRTTHYVLTPEGEIRSGMVFDYMLKLSVDDDVGVVSGCAKQRDVNTIVMYLVKNERFSQRFVDFVNEMTEKHVSPSMNVEFEFVDELPRSPTGKLQSFSTDIDINAELEKIRAN